MNKESLLEGYINGELSPGELAELESWLLASAENRREFARTLHLHRQLRDLITGEHGQRLIVQGTATAPSVPRLGRRPWRMPAGWMATVLTAVILVAVALLLIPEPKPSSIARLSDCTDCDWTIAVPEQLQAGQELLLRSGTAEIAFDSGTRAVVVGPSIVRLEGPGLVRVQEGDFSATVPKEDVGFTVRTPALTIVDLGTEFGVRVDPDGATRLQVFQGKVTAAPADGGQSIEVAARESIVAHPEDSQLEVRKVDLAAADLRPFALKEKMRLLVGWAFEGDSLAPSIEAEECECSVLSPGAGARLSFRSEGGVRGVRLEQLRSHTLQEALSEKDYAEFSLLARDGKQLLLSDLKFQSRPGASLRLRWNLDGFSEDRPLRTGDVAQNPSQLVTQRADLGGAQTQAVTFRIYGFRHGKADRVLIDELTVRGRIIADN